MQVEGQYIVDEKGCWIWQRSCNSTGYGQTTFNKKWVQAHRLFYIRYKGEIPIGFVIDHLCRKITCVNPAHLEAVSSRTNTMRGDGLAAIRSRMTKCAKGHPFNKRNTYFRKRRNTGNSFRQCRICAIANSKYHYRQKRLLTAPKEM